VTDQSAPESGNETEGGLIEHLLELRTRLMRGLVGLAVVLVALLPFANRLFSWLALPLMDKLAGDGKLVAIGVVTPFFTPMRLAFFLAVLISVPWLLYQMWAFVAPGLYQREKKLAVPLLVSAVMLFYAGCAFALFIVLPSVFAFLAHIKPESVVQMPDINAYLDFVVVICLTFGLSFELPVAMVILALLGWVTPEQLKQARGYAIVGVFVVAAIITPPDVISQLMLAVPMCLLYEIGIFAARIVSRRRQPQQEAG
jgi:sec-independent protein translocase protein TatC